LDIIIGSGGVLSHAPDRKQSALIMMDAYQPEGVTLLTVDSIFMMPHLGVLAEHHPKAANEVFERDCLIRIGTCIAPVGHRLNPGETCLKITGPGGLREEVKYGELKLLPLGVGEKIEVVLEPARGFDVGAGKGRRLTTEVEGGVGGVFIDCRGRPLELPSEDQTRITSLRNALQALGLPLP
ncbi:MAG: glutamate mutase L, partial [Thermoproteota archaeon]